MDWKDLKDLVNEWHQSASQIEGYEDTTTDGDRIQLMLFVNRTKEGDLQLSALSTRDWVSTLSPSQFPQPEAIKKADDANIPKVTITIKQ